MSSLLLISGGSTRHQYTAGRVHNRATAKNQAPQGEGPNTGEPGRGASASARLWRQQCGCPYCLGRIPHLASEVASGRAEFDSVNMGKLGQLARLSG